MAAISIRCNYLQQQSYPAQVMDAVFAREGALGQINRREKKMKKSLMVVSLVGALGGASLVQADETNYLQEVSKKEWQGTGIGAVAGAILGGPPGFVIGAAGGALFGRSSGLEEGLKVAQKDVEQLQQHLAVSEYQHQKLDIALQNEKSLRDRQLDAIVSGFSLNIHFRTESSQLESRYQEQLNKLAVSLNRFPELKIHIDSFADERGTDGFNLVLSKMRAEVVSRQLQARGISASRIRQVMHGEKHKEYAVSDVEGLGFDRRVLIYFCRGDK